MAALGRRLRNTASDTVTGGGRSVGSVRGSGFAGAASDTHRSRSTARVSFAASTATARQGSADSAAGVSSAAGSHGVKTATGGGVARRSATPVGNQSSRSAALPSSTRRPNSGTPRTQKDRGSAITALASSSFGSDDRRITGDPSLRRTGRGQQIISSAPACLKLGCPPNSRRSVGGGRSDPRPLEFASDSKATSGLSSGITLLETMSTSKRAATESDTKFAKTWLKDQDFVLPSAEPRKGTPYTSIRVVARVRPTLQRELHEVDCIDVAHSSNIIVCSEAGDTKHFVVDEVFDSRFGLGTQAIIYSKLGHDLVMQALNGFNVCIFAYGHTGSGKTHTMLGDGTTAIAVQGDGAGLLPRFVSEVFAKIAAVNQDGEDPHYTCEYYEVYNEQIRDLLAPSGDERKRTVHVHPKYGVRINGLATSIIRNAEEALGLVHFGNQMRTVATTTMNERSSRSHAIFTFHFVFSSQISIDAGEEKETTRPTPTGTHRESTVMFVDLAGREDQLVSTNEGDRLREMCHINTSLFHLTCLITKLSENKVQPGSLSDFRNSKLTLLLSQALMGNSRTALVATLAPHLSYLDDTLATLSFAQKVKKMQTRPIINNKTSKVVLSELENEVHTLKKQLCLAQGSGAEKEQELKAAQAMIEHYKRSWEDALKDSQKVKNARSQMTMQLGLTDFRIDGSNTPRREFGTICPFFTKLSDDASLQGCCNYFLGRPVLTVGSAEDNDIVLKGVGIWAHMCEVRTKDDAGFEDEPCIAVEMSGSFEDSDEDSQFSFDTDSDVEDSVVPRVLVNGKALTKKERRREVRHGDSVILGYAHAFRLVVPTRERMMKVAKANEPGAFAHLLPTLDMETAIGEIEEESGEFKEVFPYLRRLQAHVPETVVEELLKSLRSICPLIDEANMITKEIFGANRQRFELHVLTDLFDFENARAKPKLVVCVLQPQGGRGLQVAEQTFSANQTPRGREELTPRQRGTTQGNVMLSPRSPRSPRDMSKQNSLSILPRLSPRMSITAVTQAGLVDHMIGVQGDPMLYVWTLEKFLRRLVEMRDIYQEATESHDGWPAARKRLKAKPYLNPWQELAFADVRLLAEDSGNAKTIWEDESPKSPKSPKSPDDAADVKTPSKSIVHRDLAAVGQMPSSPVESRRSSNGSMSPKSPMTIRGFAEVFQSRTMDAVRPAASLGKKEEDTLAVEVYNQEAVDAPGWIAPDAPKPDRSRGTSAAKGTAERSTDGTVGAPEKAQPQLHVPHGLEGAAAFGIVAESSINEPVGALEQTQLQVQVPQRLEGAAASATFTKKAQLSMQASKPQVPRQHSPQLQSRSPQSQRRQMPLIPEVETNASNEPSLGLEELQRLRTELQDYQQQLEKLEAEAEHDPTGAKWNRLVDLLTRFETVLNEAAAAASMNKAPLMNLPFWPPSVPVHVPAHQATAVTASSFLQLSPRLLPTLAMNSTARVGQLPMLAGTAGRYSAPCLFASFPVAPLPEAFAAPITLSPLLMSSPRMSFRSPSPAARLSFATRTPSS